MDRPRREIRDSKDQEQRLVKLYMYGEIDDGQIRIQSGPIKLMRERYKGELDKLIKRREGKVEAITAEAEIKAYRKKIKSGLTKLNHDGKRSAFDALKVSAVAAHDQVVVKGIVPSDITTTERTSA